MAPPTEMFLGFKEVVVPTRHKFSRAICMNLRRGERGREIIIVERGATKY